ncbi:hypothetical protein LZ30DRAFT_128462 [Colletotrichum cereale]|nr:hypothetical protein LZ30DRAFT_128462 [Colletotrichum cereale]
MILVSEKLSCGPGFGWLALWHPKHSIRCFLFLPLFLVSLSDRLHAANPPGSASSASVQCHADRPRRMESEDGIQGDQVERERDGALHEPEPGMGMVRWSNQPGSSPAHCRCRLRLDLGWVVVMVVSCRHTYNSIHP